MIFFLKSLNQGQTGKIPTGKSNPIHILGTASKPQKKISDGIELFEGGRNHRTFYRTFSDIRHEKLIVDHEYILRGNAK